MSQTVKNKKPDIQTKEQTVSESPNMNPESGMGGENKNKEPDRAGSISVFKKILTVPVLLVVAFSALLAFTIRWAFSFWANLSMDEIVYHLTSPLEGTGDDIMMKFYLFALLPAMIVLLAFIVLLIVVAKKKKNRYGRCLAAAFILSLITAGVSFFSAWTTLDMDDYLKNRNITSTFIEDHYVDPASVELTFPKTKRNLIFIYLESVETTFADKENGGGFDFNCIPELTELAKKNEDFSGSSKELNGGHVEPGTTFTMGGMFGMTSGLPLQVGLKAQILDNHGAMNEMYTQEHFFPSIVTLGDILESEGYNNVLFIGSDATFGGRRLFFKEHGNYEIDDFAYAVGRNWLEKKENSWGYSDWRLFIQAKERLRELSKDNKPFNLTMLTVDTHFEDGIRCPYCRDEFAGNRYAEVFACSSRQLYDFISWCQNEEWYKDTTIILSGDHITMDSDFCNKVDKDYARKTYTCYINADSEVADSSRTRQFTTFDNFPTTLAAMGVKIDGERLGLGTNIFSSEATLYETYGEEMDNELNRRSIFMEQVSEFDPETQAYKNAVTMYKATQKDESADESKVSETEKSDDSNRTQDDSSVTDSSKGDSSVPDSGMASTDSVTDSSKGDSSVPDSGMALTDSGTDSSKDDSSGTDSIPDSSLSGTDSPEDSSVTDVPADESTAETDSSTESSEQEPVSETADIEFRPLIYSEVVMNLLPAGELVTAEKRQTDGTTDESNAEKALPEENEKDDSEEDISAGETGPTVSPEVPEDRTDSTTADIRDDSAEGTSKPTVTEAESQDGSESESSVSEGAGSADGSGAADSGETSEPEGSASDIVPPATAGTSENSRPGKTTSNKISGNSLEVGPGASQMYPGIYRDKNYDFYPESILRTDPYAAFSGSRQPKTESRIVAEESVAQLKSWIKNWKNSREQNGQEEE